MARSKNLVIMFTDIVGYTARTSQQSRAENEALLREHDRLLLPIVHRYGGRRVKSIGDALLVVFNSPTDAVRCGMTMQDALFAHNQTRSESCRFHIRVALNLGEVRLAKGDVFGEAVNIAARVESITPKDEVFFSESVYLAMNKAEVPSELQGSFDLKGIPEPVQVYRVLPLKPSCVATAGDELAAVAAPPFGGMHKLTIRVGAPLDASRVLERALGASRQVGNLLDQQARNIAPLWVRVRARLAVLPRRVIYAVAVGVVAVILGAWVYQLATRRPLDEAASDIGLGRWEAVTERAQELLTHEPNSADAQVLLGHVAFADEQRKQAVEHYARALTTDGSVIADERLVQNLVEALGWVGKPAQELIAKHPTKDVIVALANRATRPGYWGRVRAVEALRAMGAEDEIDAVQTAIEDLRDGPDCGKRRDAVLRLRKLKDARALATLRDAADSGFGNQLKNSCLISEARQAIRELEGA